MHNPLPGTQDAIPADDLPDQEIVRTPSAQAAHQKADLDDIKNHSPESIDAHVRWLVEATTIDVPKIARFTGVNVSTLRTRIRRGAWTRPPSDARSPTTPYPYADVSGLFDQADLDASLLPAPLDARRNMQTALLVSRLSSILNAKLRQLRDLMIARQTNPLEEEDHAHYLKLLNAAADVFGKIQRNKDRSDDDTTIDAAGRRAAEATELARQRDQRARAEKLRDIIRQRLGIRTNRPTDVEGQ